MGNRAKFYCWLIGRLERRRMTIQEICDDWAESSSNIDGKELSVRTFHRYREEIANLFGIEIECDKTDAIAISSAATAMRIRRSLNGCSAPCAWHRSATD